MNSELSALTAALDARGVFRRTYLYYFFVFACLLISLVAVYAVWLPRITSIWVAVATGLFLAFVNVQFGFLMHDAGHNAVFDTRWKNDVFGFICGDVLAGLSYRWWAPHHRDHHIHPNNPSDDPDIVDLEAVFTYTERSAGQRRGLRRLIMRHQHNLIFFGFLGQGFAMLFHSVRFLLRDRPPYYWLELLVLAGNFTAYGFLIFPRMPLALALALVITHRLLVGVYTSLIVATNHMGMARADVQAFPDYVARQTLTSRNVRNPAWLDFLFAGLNFQIEHHLFPSMPRPHLRRAKSIVEHFCRQHSLTYHEVSLWRAMQEMREYLGQIGGSAVAAGAVPGEVVNANFAVRSKNEALIEVGIDGSQIER